MYNFNVYKTQRHFLSDQVLVYRWDERGCAKEAEQTPLLWRTPSDASKNGWADTSKSYLG